MVYFNYMVCTLITILFSLGSLVVLVPQYKLMEGDFFKLGANNEIYSIVFLIVNFACYHQHEVTEEEIKEKLELFEDAVSRRKSEAASSHQMSMKTNA